MSITRSILKIFCVVSLLPLGQFALAQSSKPSDKKSEQQGILLLAHGGSVRQWDEDVRHLADRVDLVEPTEIAFGMAQRSTIQAAVNRLLARGVTQITAVPLFISSHSSLVESTAYLLGLRSKAPEDLEMFASMDHEGAMSGHDMKPDPDKTEQSMKPVITSAPIRMAPALDHHAIVADILLDRAASISKHPKQEVVVLVAHGPVPDDDNKLWLGDMDILAAEMRKHTHYAGIEYLTLRDDADEPVRNTATQQLQQKVKQIDDSGHTALIVPLLLAYGGIEDGIQKRLTGLKYRMATQGLLPDERLVNWVLDEAQIRPSQSKDASVEASVYGFQTANGIHILASPVAYGFRREDAFVCPATCLSEAGKVSVASTDHCSGSAPLDEKHPAECLPCTFC